MNLNQSEEQSVVPEIRPSAEEITEQNTEIEKTLEKLTKMETFDRWVDRANFSMYFIFLFSLMVVGKFSDKLPDSFGYVMVSILGLFLLTVVLSVPRHLINYFPRKKLVEKGIGVGDKRILHHALLANYLTNGKRRSKVIPILNRVNAEDAGAFSKRSLDILHSHLQHRTIKMGPAYMIREWMPFYSAVAHTLGFVGNAKSLRVLKRLYKDDYFARNFPEFYAMLQVSVERLTARLEADSTKENLLRPSSPVEPSEQLLRSLKEGEHEESGLLLRPMEGNTPPSER